MLRAVHEIVPPDKRESVKKTIVRCMRASDARNVRRIESGIYIYIYIYIHAFPEKITI
jgi:hypothetical protein